MAMKKGGVKDRICTVNARLSRDGVFSIPGWLVTFRWNHRSVSVLRDEQSSSRALIA